MVSIRNELLRRGIDVSPDDAAKGSKQPPPLPPMPPPTPGTPDVFSTPQRLPSTTAKTKIADRTASTPPDLPPFTARSSSVGRQRLASMSSEKAKRRKSSASSRPSPVQVPHLVYDDEHPKDDIQGKRPAEKTKVN